MHRLVAALIVIALALCGLWSVIHWNDDPNPLLIDAAAIVTTPLPGETPIAIPDPNALFAPCPMTPRNVLQLHPRDA